MVTKHLLIRGRVQGVFFRESLRRVADQHRVRGWVRNRTDGSVEALLQGASPEVEQVVQWARQGPTGARVDAVQVTELESHPRMEGFARLPTTS